MSKKSIAELLEMSKPELQTLYQKITGIQPKQAQGKPELAQAIFDNWPEEIKQGPEIKAGEELTGDDKIIAENPGATPYELLELGLSQAGFEKLITLQSDPLNENTAAKPGSGEYIPEVKELAPGYENQVTPQVNTQTLVAQKREERQSGSDEQNQPLKPTLIAKVSNLPGDTVAKKMAGATAKKMVDLRPHSLNGGVKIQKGNGQPEIVSLLTAERLMRLSPGEYKIIT